MGDTGVREDEGLKAITATLDFPAHIVPLLPDSDRSWHFASCALVRECEAV